MPSRNDPYDRSSQRPPDLGIGGPFEVARAGLSPAMLSIGSACARIYWGDVGPGEKRHGMLLMP